MMILRNEQRFGEECLNIWFVLVRKTGEPVPTIPYSQLSQASGVPFRNFIGECPHLDAIYDYCLRNDLPPIAVLAVSRRTRRPGGRYVPVVDIESDTEHVCLGDWTQTPTPNWYDFRRREYIGMR